MEEWLHLIARHAVVVIDCMGVAIVAIAAIEAFFVGLWKAFSPSASESERRYVWIRFARWLVAGLTFLLAADIIETTLIPGWQEIGRLAAVAAVRTFLDFFLERDLTEAVEREPP
jgi:uncharacterized membrane protein